MINDYNNPDDLMGVKLACKVCGSVQTVMLPSDEKLSKASENVPCCVCGEKGRFKLAPAKTPRMF